MRNHTLLALIALPLALAACGKSGDDRSASSEQVEANLDAENFDTTISPDEATLNEAEAQQLNVVTQ